MKETYLQFRKVKTFQELEEIFRIRYKTYADGPLSVLCQRNTDGLEIDEWDRYSEHFGLFRCDGMQEIPIGAIRFVKPKFTKYKMQVEYVLAKYNIHRPLVPCHQFPSMSYFDSSQLDIDTDDLLVDNIVEASRFCILKKYRSARLGLFMFESMLSLFHIIVPYEKVILSCRISHSKLYQSYGATILSDCRKENVLTNIRPSCLLFYPKTNSFTNSLRAKYLKKIFLRDHSISYDPISRKVKSGFNDDNCFKEKFAL